MTIKQVLFCLLVTLHGFAQDGRFSFTLPAPASTSAGVFKKNGTLVRTLWSNVKYKDGTFTETWDGKDDYGAKLVRPDADYDIKVVSNNVNYTWDGTIGNTSDAKTGISKHRGYYFCMKGLAFADNGYGYFCKGFSESNASLAKFATASPQAKIDFYFSGTRLISLNTEFVATDNVNVYWAGFDSYSKKHSMVHAIRTRDDADVIFKKGKPYAVTYGMLYKSVISKENKMHSRITGLAVQKNGDFLFVARAGLNELQIIDKSSGDLIDKLKYPAVRGLCIDKDDNLWMITGNNRISKYKVNRKGALSSPVLTLVGLQNPLALQVSYNGVSIVVADGGASQQVKFFDNNSGTAGSVLGNAGGYQSDPDVTNNKFYFNDLKGDQAVFLAFQPNGSLWVGDGGNSRAQHYSSNLSYIDRIMSLGSSYFVYADPNNPTRLWAGFLEFEIDYGSPLSGSTGWKLVKNWGANVSSSYNGPVLYPTTLSNGRTYALIRRNTATYNREVVEFPSSGPLRFTGVLRTGAQILAPDGAVQVMNKAVIGGISTIDRFALRGFTGSNNPMWNFLPEVIATTPVLTANDPNDILTGNCITSTNKVVIWNPDTRSGNNVLYTSYHLGSIQRGTNSWVWKTEKATHAKYRGPYPGAGFFDIGNGVHNNAGGTLSIFDRNLITSYHGEFWKNTQTNKYNHYYDNGLAIGQFGVVKEETVGESPAMYAGNALTPMIVKDPASADAMYLYHGDESTHSGVHRWHITGLNTIAEQSVSITYPSAYNPVVAIPFTDLMQNLPFDQVLPGAVAGWTRSPNTNSPGWDIVTSYYNYNKLAPNDLRLNFTQPRPATYYLNRDLGSNNVTNNWKINGNIAWEGKEGNRASVGLFLEVLDKAGKLIANIFYNRNFNTVRDEVMGNTATLFSYPSIPSRDSTKYFKYFEIAMANGSLSISYNGKTALVSMADARANWRKPATLRVRCFTNLGLGPATNKSMNLDNLKFYKDFNRPAGNQPPIADAGNDLTLNLPASSARLKGKGTDADGKVVSYKWVRLSGPAGSTVLSANTANTSVIGLIKGIYQFELTVTDDNGATGKDIVAVTVNPDPNNKNNGNGNGKGNKGIVPANVTLANAVNSVVVAISAISMIPANASANLKMPAQAAITNGNVLGLKQNMDIRGTTGTVLNGFHVFPNPLNVMANLDITASIPNSKIVISVANSAGMLVIQKNVFINQHNTLYQLDMGGLNDGLYFITILFNGQQKATQKVIKSIAPSGIQ